MSAWQVFSIGTVTSAKYSASVADKILEPILELFQY